MSEEIQEPRPVHDVHEEEIQQLKDFVRTYGKTIGTAVLVAVVAVSAIKLYQHNKRSSRQEASKLLIQARSINDLQDLISRYPSTAAAPLSLLKLAKAEYEMGNHRAARGRYEEFVATYPEHELVAAAVLGQVLCDEASGNYQGAIAGYRGFTGDHPDHFLVPQAILGEGRCLRQLDMKEDARVVYEDFIAANPESPWAGHVEEALELIEKDAYERDEEPQPVQPESMDLMQQGFSPPIMSPMEVVPAEPEPSEATPEEPEPVKVVPEQPEQPETAPVEPEPQEVIPAQPESVDVAPEQPDEAEVSPVEPEPREVAPAEPEPVEE